MVVVDGREITVAGCLIFVGCRLASRLSLKAVIDAPIHDRVQVLNTADGWYPAINSSGATREAPRVAGPTELVADKRRFIPRVKIIRRV